MLNKVYAIYLFIIRVRGKKSKPFFLENKQFRKVVENNLSMKQLGTYKMPILLPVLILLYICDGYRQQ